MNTLQKKIILAVMVCAVIAGGITHRYVGFESGHLVYPKPSQQVARLQKTAAEMNMTLPMMVDVGTRLDNTFVLGQTFVYNYTLIHYNADELSANDISIFLATAMLNKYCTTDVSFVKQGVSVDYDYYGNDARLIGKISVAPSQCLHHEPVAEN